MMFVSAAETGCANENMAPTNNADDDARRAPSTGKSERRDCEPGVTARGWCSRFSVFRDKPKLELQQQFMGKQIWPMAKASTSLRRRRRAGGMRRLFGFQNA